jgi:hypothetical protein
MRIAFDLDDTLIPCGCAGKFPIERLAPAPLALVLRPVLGTGMRCGSRALLRELRRRGHDLWVYTTSGRSCGQVRMLFLLQGVPLGGVVNARRHEDLVAAGHCPDCSKYPPAFGIDLLIDDATGVALEGLEYGFPVIHIAPEDPDWTKRVLAAVH